MSTDTVYNNFNEAFLLNGNHYTIDSIKVLAESLILSDNVNETHLGEFILNWIDDSKQIVLKTSGTTSKPKHIIAQNLLLSVLQKQLEIFLIYYLKILHCVVCLSLI